MPIGFKWLDAEEGKFRSVHDKLTEWKPGETVTVEGKLEPCENGLHFTTPQGFYEWMGWGNVLFIAEYSDEHVLDDDRDKVVARSGKIISRVSLTERQANKFLDKAIGRPARITLESWVREVYGFHREEGNAEFGRVDSLLYESSSQWSIESRSQVYTDLAYFILSEAGANVSPLTP